MRFSHDAPTTNSLRTKASNVVHIKFNIFHVGEGVMHYFGGDVRGFANPHWKPTVTVKTERCGNSTEISRGFIHIKCVVLH